MLPTTLLIAMLFCIGFAAQWAAWRSKIPAILFLLLAGVFIGPALNWLNPDQLFGDLLFPMISLAVAVILFEGALTLRLDEVRSLGKVVRKLVTVGALVHWVIIALGTYWLFDVSKGIAILFGAIMTVTGPTVIVPMLRTVRPTARIGKILRWEGIVIDPIGALLAVVVFEFISSTQTGHALGHSLVLFIEILFAGLVLGAGGGHVLGLLLRHHLIPEYLQNMATLTLVFTVYACSDYLAHESGLLAVTVMGMWLANMRGVHIEEILNFKENLSIVLISGLFIILAARITPADIAQLGLQGLVLFAIIQFVARPLNILAATLGSDLSWRERALLSWIAPRGIVAAAVSALFALQLENRQIHGSELLVSLTFTAIIGTVLLQSLTAKPLAKLLKVAESSPRGFLIIGANPVAQALGAELKSLGFEVVLSDSNWSNVRKARMSGLNVFYGNAVSEYADQKLDLVGIGKMLGLSPYREMNTIAAMRYKAEFGKNNIYTLLADSDTMASDKHGIAAEHRGYILFNQYLTYSRMDSLLREGAEIKKTKITREFTFETYLAHNQKQVIPLFALSPKGRLEVFVHEGKLKPEPGWTVVSLSFKDAK